MPVRVLFVCLGNICRSPMAEAVFTQMVDEAGLSDQITADSAGLDDWHTGERAHPGTRKILARQGIDFKGTARQITPGDFGRFDYILAMDGQNLAALRRMVPRNAPVIIKRFTDFAEDGTVRDIEDPYFTGRFEEVYKQVRVAAEGLLQYIRQTEGI